MPEFVTALAIMCGLPLSGKSTYVRELRRQAPWVVVCPDDIRLALHGKDYYQPAEGLVWANAELMVRSLLRREQMVVVDATNVTTKQRITWLKIAREFDIPLQVYVMQTNPEACKYRARWENRPEMYPVIDRMNEAWEPVYEADDVRVIHVPVKASL